MEAHQLINQTSGEFEYYTPSVIIEAAREVMGIIDLDPASSGAANLTVKAVSFYTIHDDGLTLPWKGCVWMNHPFGRESNPKWINWRMKMGEIAEMMLDGTLCECCGTYIGRSNQGYPGYCSKQCAKDRGALPEAIEKEKCSMCSRKIHPQGRMQHMRDKHGGVELSKITQSLSSCCVVS